MNAFDALHRCCDEGKVDADTFPDKRFRENLAWFVDEHNDVRPPYGWYLDNRPYETDLRTLLLDARSAALTSLREACENECQDPEWLIHAIKERAVDGVIHFSSHDDELAMNAIFAHWFVADPEAHLLVRWLLEAEFLDAYGFKDNDEISALDEGKRYSDFERVVHPPPSEPALSDIFHLPISGEWKAVSNHDKKHHMGPAGRLLTYWIRGEMLGSLPFHALSSGDAVGVDFVVPGTESLRPFANDNRESRIFKRARLHAVARTEVITHVDQHDGVVERWRLCDTTKSRFDHVLSESWSVNDASWSECAMRGLTEELDLIEPHQEDLDVVSVGGARFELRESGSMRGLMTLTLVQDFLAEIPEARSGLRDVQKVDGQNLPQKRFEIPDGGGAELVWAPALRAGAHPSKAIKPFVEAEPLVGEYFHGVHCMSDEQNAHLILWMFGAAIAIHTSNEPEDLFQFIREDEDAEARLERLRHHPVGRFFLDDSDGLGLATIDRTGPIARRGCAKQIQWNAFSKALHSSQQEQLHRSLKPFFDADLLPDWNMFSSKQDNMRRKAKSRLFDALGALCFHLYDAQEERHILQVLREKQEALRGDEAVPHKRAQLLVHDAALALEPGPDSKAWKAYRDKVADLIEYLCTTQALSLRNSDGNLDVTNLVRGSSSGVFDAANSGEASATFLIRGDGSVVEDQGRYLDLSVWEEASKSLSSGEQERAAAVENLRTKGAIQRRYR